MEVHDIVRVIGIKTIPKKKKCKKAKWLFEEALQIVSPGACSNSCPWSQWCHPTIWSYVALFSSCPQSFPNIRVFSNELALHIKWPKYWSFTFSINPSNEYSGFISFRIDWSDHLSVQGTLKSLLQHQFESINSLALSLLYGPGLIYLYWLLEKP